MNEARARWSIAVFLLLLVILTALAVVVPRRLYEIHVVAYAATPALAALITRLVLREGFGGMGWTTRGQLFWQAMLIGFAVPIAVGLLVYIPAWLTGIVAFTPWNLSYLGLQSGFGSFGILIAMVITSAVICIAGLPTAFGEEIGWRGHLLLRLLEARIFAPYLWCGLIWGAWHFPLILLGFYSDVGVSPGSLLQMGCFMVSIVAAAYLFAYLRLGSASMLPVTVAHAWWNAVTQGALNPVAQDATARLFVGEGGMLTAAAMVVLTALVWRLWPGSRINSSAAPR
ncbi:MAG: CPBP family intramembrane glutamic endopeptidase [Burkholderiales bacterium]